MVCRGRKVWILTVPPAGEVWLDAGALRAVRDRKKSLFSAGIAKVWKGGVGWKEGGMGGKGDRLAAVAMMAAAVVLGGVEGLLLLTYRLWGVVVGRPGAPGCGGSSTIPGATASSSSPSLQVVGTFIAQDAVRLCDEEGVEFARALVNYSSEEVERVKVGWE
jgi:hypothetical protein